MSAARWLRPMAASTGSDMVWGFTEIRLPPPARMARSFSRVMVSGRPASTVNSVPGARAKASFTLSSRAASWPASRVVGVPPPMYTARTVFPARRAAAPAASISVSRASRYWGISRLADPAAEMKEQ